MRYLINWPRVAGIGRIPPRVAEIGPRLSEVPVRTEVGQSGPPQSTTVLPKVQPRCVSTNRAWQRGGIRRVMNHREDANNDMRRTGRARTERTPLVWHGCISAVSRLCLGDASAMSRLCLAARMKDEFVWHAARISMRDPIHRPMTCQEIAER